MKNNVGIIKERELMVSRDEVIQANIVVHSRMIDSYNSEPHWNQENQEKVRNRLDRVLPSSRETAIDLGAGTGFLTQMLAPLFDTVYAVDVTEKMLNRMKPQKNIITILGSAENLDFPDNYFDMVSAYSFLHHLYEPSLVLREAYRVLKPGGILYFDLEPNSEYWEFISFVEKYKLENKLILEDDFISKEIRKTLYIEKVVEEEFGIPAEIFYTAEYSKGRSGGLRINDLEKELMKIGFKDVELTRDWFLGQGLAIHEQSKKFSDDVESWLRKLAPASNYLFKYFFGVASK